MPAANENEVQNGEKEQGEKFSVFVGKLSSEVTVDVLKDHFKSVGEVVTVRIPRKIAKGVKRLGFAFVDLANKNAYEEALKKDKSLLDGQPILVLPASRTHEGLMMMEEDDDEEEEEEKEEEKEKEDYLPVFKKSEFVGFIKNLPTEVTEGEVLEFLGIKREDIVDMIILGSPFPKNRKKAKRPARVVIAFKTAEDLDKALALSKTKFKDREVLVEKHAIMRKEKRSAEEGDESNANPEKRIRTEEAIPTELDLFVKNIPKEAVDRHIKDFFASAGAFLEKVGLFKDVTGSHKGIGYVTTKSEECLQKGLLLNNKRFFKNKVRVTIPRENAKDGKEEIDPEKNFSTFIGNLNVKDNVEAVKKGIMNLMKKHDCNVKDLLVPTPPNKFGNRGYAFIDFEDEESFKKCQGFTNPPCFIGGNKVIITVTDRWPESAADALEWARQEGKEEPKLKKFASPTSGVGRGRGRGRGGPGRDRWFSSRSESWGRGGPPRGDDFYGGPPRGGDFRGGPPYGDFPGGLPHGDFPGGPPHGDFPGGPRGDFVGGPPLDDYAGGPPRGGDFPGGPQRDFPSNFASYNDYQDYLDYLDYRKYVSMKKETQMRRFEDADDPRGGPVGPVGPAGPGRPMPPVRGDVSMGGPAMVDSFGRGGPPRKEEGFRGGGGFDNGGWRGPPRDDVPERSAGGFNEPLSSVGSRRPARDYPDYDTPRGGGDSFAADRPSGPGGFSDRGRGTSGGFNDSPGTRTGGGWYQGGSEPPQRGLPDSGPVPRSGSFRDSGPRGGIGGGGSFDARQRTDLDDSFGRGGDKSVSRFSSDSRYSDGPARRSGDYSRPTSFRSGGDRSFGEDKPNLDRSYGDRPFSGYSRKY